MPSRSLLVLASPRPGRLLPDSISSKRTPAALGTSRAGNLLFCLDSAWPSAGFSPPLGLALVGKVVLTFPPSSL